jgi:hypothetical protein
MARSMMALKPQALSAGSSLSALSVVTTHALCAESPVQTEQWCCCFCRPRSTFGLAKIVAIRASSQRCRSMTTVCARRELATEPELRTPGAAAQTRMVSVARIRLDPHRSMQSFKGIVCDDVSEFESCMPSQAVCSPPPNTLRPRVGPILLRRGDGPPGRRSIGLC